MPNQQLKIPLSSAIFILISRRYFLLLSVDVAKAVFVSWGIGYTFSVLFPNWADVVMRGEGSRAAHPEVLSAAALTILALDVDNLTKFVIKKLGISPPDEQHEYASFFAQRYSIYYANWIGASLILVLRQLAEIDTSIAALPLIVLSLVNTYTIARIPFISLAYVLAKSSEDERQAWKSSRTNSWMLALPIGTAMCITPLQFLLPVLTYPFFCAIALNATCWPSSNQIDGGKHKAEGAETSQAWVWSQYQGMSAQSQREHGAPEEDDPMLSEEKSLHPFATAIGLVFAVAAIFGLVWLFTPQPP